MLAVTMALLRLPRVVAAEDAAGVLPARDLASAWQYRHLVLGAVAIFVYVGAEVAIGSFLVNLMSEPQVAGLEEAVAGRYWPCTGVVPCRALHRRGTAATHAARHLARLKRGGSLRAAIVAMTLWASCDVVAAAIGLCNSIMFPTIFTLASRASVDIPAPDQACCAWPLSAVPSCHWCRATLRIASRCCSHSACQWCATPISPGTARAARVPFDVLQVWVAGLDARWYVLYQHGCQCTSKKSDGRLRRESLDKE